MRNLAMSLKSRAVSDPLTLNGLPIGFIPDVGSDGGNVQTMVGINGLLAGRGQSYAYGFYDQTQYGTIYNGAKLLAHAADIYASGAILEASIMPVGSWGGYTQVDNSQAQAVCKVMKRFTDAGVEVRLRFAHEVNYYVTTGEYDRAAALALHEPAATAVVGPADVPLVDALGEHLGGVGGRAHVAEADDALDAEVVEAAGHDHAGLVEADLVHTLLDADRSGRAGGHRVHHRAVPTEVGLHGVRRDHVRQRLLEHVVRRLLTE